MIFLRLLLKILRFPLRHLNLYFILLFWIFSNVRFYSGNIYFSILFAFLFHLPFFITNLPIKSHVLLFPSLTLLFTSISLTYLDMSFQAFLIFLQFDFIFQFKSGSLYSLIDILFEIFALFLSDFESDDLKYVILMIGLNFCSCYSICIATDFKLFNNTFNLFSSCLIALLHTSKGAPLNTVIFIFSLFLSLPHLPIPTPPQQLNLANVKCIFYILISLFTNIISMVVGLKYHNLSLVSDAMMSTCNCVAMGGEIVADVAARMKPTKKFSFGFKRGKVTCDFAVTVLLIYVSYDLIVQAITSILEPQIEIDASPILFFVSLLGFGLNLFGVFFLDTLNLTNCTCASDGNSMSVISDFMSSTAVVISAFLSVYYGINFIDPFVSILISLMILSISFSQMIELLNILMQRVPSNFDKDDFLNKINENSETDAVIYNSWSIDEETKIVTLKWPDQNRDDFELMMNNVTNMSKSNKLIDITCEVRCVLPSSV
ncbi:hypothetical protein TRFO_05574 [Tritrichomonas foetus]|uniref:Cation efflux protein transmembrane domain-containing protein n=1 Tax=Tritrichomonas foetus TaxID=1144522 RepID=A0A1J4K5W0_9EUKA|nr:hypothetical protein TRFO_05574 [Tritrichomonas foetus]|eukprot:OHT06378.1 hypothetical protein TRFO_05574 [Tritrichomonas foetus]